MLIGELTQSFFVEIVSHYFSKKTDMCLPFSQISGKKNKKTFAHESKY